MLAITSLIIDRVNKITFTKSSETILFSYQNSDRFFITSLSISSSLTKIFFTDIIKHIPEIQRGHDQVRGSQPGREKC